MKCLSGFEERAPNRPRNYFIVFFFVMEVILEYFVCLFVITVQFIVSPWVYIVQLGGHFLSNVASKGSSQLR